MSLQVHIFHKLACPLFIMLHMLLTCSPVHRLINYGYVVALVPWPSAKNDTRLVPHYGSSEVY